MVLRAPHADASTGGMTLDEQARVDEAPVEHDGPMEMRAGGMAGVAFKADDLAGRDPTALGDGTGVLGLHVGIPGLE